MCITQSCSTALQTVVSSVIVQSNQHLSKAISTKTDHYHLCEGKITAGLLCKTAVLAAAGVPNKLSTECMSVIFLVAIIAPSVHTGIKESPIKTMSVQ